MLLRNIKHLGNHIFEVVVLYRSNVGDKVFIPRMTLTTKDSIRFPKKFKEGGSLCCVLYNDEK